MLDPRDAQKEEGLIMFVAQFGTGQVFWSLLWFSLFFLYVYLAITIIMDVLRSGDLSGVAKASWTLFVIILPFLGVFTYLVVRGTSMDASFRPEHTREQIERSQRPHAPVRPGDGSTP
jgi:uncharacterized protein YybS (DUF2232 family)